MSSINWNTCRDGEGGEVVQNCVPKSYGSSQVGMSSYVGAGIILLVVAVALLMFFCTLVLKKNLRGWMKKSFLKPILFGLCLLLIVGGGVLFAYDYSMHSRVVSTNREQGIMYPEIDESLSEARQILLRQIRHQYDDPLAPTEYSDGIVEPWCADFVSYVILQASLHGAGEAFKNPHSGSWRIPGVYTMREYFESKGEFYTVDSDYLPRPGDVVFYDGGTFGTHVNFVVWSDAGEDEFLDNDEIYTVGGNENGKILLSSVYYRFEKYGVIGFGRIVE